MANLKLNVCVFFLLVQNVVNVYRPLNLIPEVLWHNMLLILSLNRSVNNQDL